MQKREKILVIVILGLIVTWQVFRTAKPIVWGPVQDRRDQLANLNSTIETGRETQMKIAAANKKMKRWREQSLPPVPNDAQRLYQIWLDDLLENVGFLKYQAKPGLLSQSSRSARGETSAYATVTVNLTGQATLNQVRDFLFRFYRSDLLHRVSNMKLVAEEDQGNPLLEVTITCEGVAMTSASPRNKLFPTTDLSSNLLADEGSIQVDLADGFPKKTPFRVRIDGEYLTVTGMGPAKENAAHQTWMVERGVDDSRAEAHAADSTVELAPINPAMKDRTRDDYKLIVTRNPFAKPGPVRDYNPHFEPISSQTVVRGTPWSLPMNAVDFNQSLGRRDFRLGDSPPKGMQIDEETGEITWNPTAENENGNYEVEVHAEQPGVEGVKIAQTISIRLRDANRPPSLQRIGGLKAVRGQQFRREVAATDSDNPNAKLTYSLGQGGPPGATIHPSTGVMTWSPADNSELKSYTFEVKVTDDDTPAMSASENVTLSLIEDVALYTFLTAYVEANGQPEAWLYDRSSNQRLILTEGLDFKFAELQGSVREIDRDYVLLDLDGETFRVNMGHNLRSMTRHSAATTN